MVPKFIRSGNKYKKCHGLAESRVRSWRRKNEAPLPAAWLALPLTIEAAAIQPATR
jgi:hypothetical protein